MSPNTNTPSPDMTTSCGPDCGCVPRALPRRNFLTLTGLTLASAALGSRASFAEAPAPTEFERLIPADKKLKPEWVRSLTARGQQAVYTKSRDELKYIGMPVGGLCCGTMYLSGDGRLWVWDIFNQNQNGILPRSVHWDGFGQGRNIGAQDGSAYVQPHTPQSPLAQGFAVRVGGKARPLDASGWENVSFTGTYPIGTVDYADAGTPLTVRLTAYSPFIPLDIEDSGLPATICEIRLHNTGAQALTVEVGGYLQNAASLFTAQAASGRRINTIQTAAGATILACRFADPADAAAHDTAPPRQVLPEIAISHWETGRFGDWTVAGNAFGTAPVLRTAAPPYQGDLGGSGKYVINTHSTGPGTTVEERDRGTGTLTSPPFTIERDFLTFFIGGGANIDEVGMRLIVGGATVRRIAGQNNNHMEPAFWDLTDLRGKSATLEIYDRGTGPWGNVGVDRIVQTDVPRFTPPRVSDRDYGTLALALLEPCVGKAQTTPETLFDAVLHEAPRTGNDAFTASAPAKTPLIGGLSKAVTLKPGEMRTLTFVVAWHFPNSGLGNVTDAGSGNYYATRFADAPAVAAYIATHYPRLSANTKLWRDTWYDATLPHWFLDRTFANTSILATTTAHRFGTGRFWGWEGIGCCEGTCTHVWHYAQAVGRLFPEFERHTREFVDFGVAFDPKSGQIGYRGEHTGPAVDGQCGRILGAYREHTMSPDGAFLRRVYPRVREAMEFLMRHDSNGDGLLDGAQENTLDAAWFGKIAWISSLYAAALRACALMATEASDSAFAELCTGRLARTRAAIEAELFNGEYFIQKPEPGKEGALGTYQTCHIDQVHGQSWAWQVGLGRVLDRDKTVTALHSLYRYNFTPDVGAFRRKNTPGRAYALEGDGGLIMSTNPQEIAHAFGNSADWQYGYFNECMSGFEHQAASHMIAEGLVQEGLSVTRAIHDRYHPALRNPYNEVECSDHYSRSMASYGSFITACGFEYHGPTGHISFAPRITPEDFRAPFTAAEGWGTFAQKQTGKALHATLTVKHGSLRLKTFALAQSGTHVTVTHNGKSIAASAQSGPAQTVVTFAEAVVIRAGETLGVVLG